MADISKTGVLAGLGLSLFMLPLILPAAVVEGFVGQSATQVAPGMSVKLIDGNSGQVVDIDNTNFFGKYKFKGVAPGYYRLQVGDIQRELVIKGAKENKRLDIDLSAKGGAMDYSKAGREPAAPASAPKGKGSVGGSAAGANNATLQQQIAGVWWGYAGSTERKIGLCPDGSYMDFRESGYSGRHYDSGGYQTGAWGAAGQSGGQGRWTIQGDTQSGVIHVQYNSGDTAQLRYNQIGNPGCLNIDGSKLCRESARCR